jgi:hypothetical protein
MFDELRQHEIKSYSLHVLRDASLQLGRDRTRRRGRWGKSLNHHLHRFYDVVHAFLILERRLSSLIGKSCTV